MNQIIIRHAPDVTNQAALRAVQDVMNEGMISEARGFPKYCHVTVFRRTMRHMLPLEVYTNDRRHADAPHSFYVKRHDQ